MYPSGEDKNLSNVLFQFLAFSRLNVGVKLDFEHILSV